MDVSAVKGRRDVCTRVDPSARCDHDHDVSVRVFHGGTYSG